MNKKQNKWVVSIFPSYSPKLNKIESTFGRFKSKISFQYFNNKIKKRVIINEIKKYNIFE